MRRPPMSIGAAMPRMECVEFAVKEMRTRNRMAALAVWNWAARRMIGGFQEVEHCRHGSTAALEKRIRHVTGEQRACRGYEGDQECQELELGGLQIHMVKVLHVAGEPLVHRLPHCARAGVGAGGDPYRRVGHDGTNDLRDRGRYAALARSAFIANDSREAGLLGCLLHRQRHADGHRGADQRRRPE